MIVLGLGSNIGDRLGYMRQALAAIKSIPTLSVKRVSPVYLSAAQLPDNAPPEWNQEFFNCAVSCECNLTAPELLTVLKKIEKALGRGEHENWSPRVIDIDILAWHSRAVKSARLTIPHPRLMERPFALWPLADIYPDWQIPNSDLTAEQAVEQWGSRYDNNAPFHTRQIYQRIDTPRLVGIVNVTPDSFSDGGKFYAEDHAFEQSVHLLEAGAEILDFGAESTAPTSTALNTEEEWQRLSPVLKAVIDAKQHMIMQPIISVDTRNADVAEKALNLGVDWINDVTGLTCPRMRDVMRQSSSDCVVMHHLSIPPVRGMVIPRNKHPADFLYDWGKKQIEMLDKDGIAPERVIFDPGFGFGKSTGQAIAMLNSLEKFAKLGVRVLIGHSRKSFMANFSEYPAPERDIETLTMSLYMANQSVDYLRIHDVKNTARAFRVNAFLSR